MALVILVGATLSLPVEAQSAASEAKVYVSTPAGPIEAKLGTEHDVKVKVTLVLSNMECTSEATAKVTLAAADQGSAIPGIMVHGYSGDLEFKIPAGTYQSLTPTGATAYNESKEVAASVMVTSSAPDDHHHVFDFKAVFEGGTPSGCQAASAPVRASGSAAHAIHIPAAPTTHTTPPTSNEATPQDAPAPKGAPGVPFLWAVLLAGLIVVVLRRRD